MIPMRKVENVEAIFAAVHASEPGAFCFGDVVLEEGGPVAYRVLNVALPANADGSGASYARIPVNAPESAASWDWDGNEDAPTLSPSIWHDKPSGWHGFIRAGQLVSA